MGSDNSSAVGSGQLLLGRSRRRSRRDGNKDAPDAAGQKAGKKLSKRQRKSENRGDAEETSAPLPRASSGSPAKVKSIDCMHLHEATERALEALINPKLEPEKVPLPDSVAQR